MSPSNSQSRPDCHRAASLRLHDELRRFVPELAIISDAGRLRRTGQVHFRRVWTSQSLPQSNWRCQNSWLNFAHEGHSETVGGLAENRLALHLAR